MPIEAQGTLKVKTSDGQLVPFLPKTDIRNVKDRETGTDVVQSISNINERLADKASKSCIKVMYELPTEENTESFLPKTLIGAVVPTSSERKMFFNATISAPSNGSFYQYGEQFIISYDAFNASNEDVSNATINIIDRDVIENVSIDIAEARQFIYEGIVNADDIQWCMDEGRAKLLESEMTFEGSDGFTFYGNNAVDFNCLPIDPDYYDPSIQVSISTSTVPSNGFDLGSTIEYTFRIQNNTNGPLLEPLSYAVMDGYETELLNGQTEIAIGEIKTFIGNLIVTENEILNPQSMALSGIASATNFLGEEKSVSTSRSIPVASPNPKLNIALTTTNSPQEGNFWTDGETVHYKIYVSNIGNLTLYNIVVVDQNTGTQTTLDSLAPGQEQYIASDIFNFTVPIGNEEGIISKTATATAEAPEGLTTTFQIKKLSIITDKNRNFQYTANTTKVSSTNTKTSAPFSTANESTEISVEWGDGTTSTFNSSTEDRTHSYASPGTYVIKVSSTDWATTNFITATGTASVTESDNPTLYWFRNTLTALNGIIPNIANTSLAYAFVGCSKLSSLPEALFMNCSSKSNFSYCFYGCTSLQSLPEDLFNYCTSSSSFDSCFYGCNGLTSIPSTIFENCTAVTTVKSLFYNCSNLTALPESLFASCSGIMNFHSICRGCTRLQTIPEDLFKYSPNATDFGGAFWSCQNIQSIPEDLLRYNTAATDVGAFFCSAKGPAFANFPVDFLKYNVNVTTLRSDNYGFFEGSAVTSFSLRIGSRKVSDAQYFCYSTTTTGVTRIIYVPAGSTTKNTLQNYASSFALTIVEE